MYRHSLDDLMSYARSMGISLVIPSWVNAKKYESYVPWVGEYLKP